MMERLIAELGEKLDLTAEELADIIWLTLMRQQNTIPDRPSKIETPPAIAEVPPAETVELPPPVISGAIEPQPTTANKQKTTADKPQKTADQPQKTADQPQKTADQPQKNAEPEIGIAPRRSQTNPFNCLPIKVANPPSIRDPLALVRSLRPLMRQVPAGQIEGLDESATARQIAESGIWQPIVKPVLEPWWDVVLVADESASMSIWRQTVLEFRQLLRNYGAFRDVQLWGLYGAEEKTKGKRPCLRPGIGSEALKSAPRQPEEILDPSGRRLIVLISDCVAACWQDEALIEMLGLWSKHSPVAIAQVLPQWLWVRTACRGFEPVQLTALESGVSNSQLVVDWSGVWEAESDRKTGVCVPIVPLEPDAILTWSQMVMGRSEAPGYWVRSSSIEPQPSEPTSLSPQQCVEQFQVMSSPAAQRLMGLVAASPVIALPVIRLIQETMLPESRQMNVAEVLLGGLLEPINPPLPGANPDGVEYRFVDEAIRDLLLAQTPVPDTVSVLSKFVERPDRSLDQFVAELQRPISSEDAEDAELVEKTRCFATVTASVLKRKGGKYREFVRQIEDRYGRSPQPPLKRGAKSNSVAPEDGEANSNSV
ncbi:MAG: SAV_2336 N-terminal domain-related protein, partial [Microcoleus sp.]